MKKSLIAVAVASAFIAPAAMAEVTISGAINLGIEYGKSSAGSQAGAQSLSIWHLNSNYSHVDIESVDDIGGGNKVIFHYQLVAQPQNASGNNNFNRNSFLGVAGSWGAFKMGTNENVYERFMYTADPLDGAVGPGGNLNLLGTPGANVIFQAGQNPGTPQAGFYRRTDQTVWYESPNWSGFAFEVDYALPAFKTTGPNPINPQVLSIGGKFQPDGAPFYVDLSYEHHKDMFGLDEITGATPGIGAAGGKTSSDRGIQIGVGYNIGDLGLNARYEQLKYKDDGVVPGGIDEWKRNAYWFGAKYNLPTGYVGGEVGIAQDGKTNNGKANDTGAKLFAVGYFHNLSKQSQLQFIYGRTDNDDNATYGQAGAPGANPGATAQVFHVGLKHTF
jgi:predicted porin